LLTKNRVFLVTVLFLIASFLQGCITAEDKRIHPNLPAQLTDFQAQILDDGVVTDAEYEEAVIALLTCVEDAGFYAYGPLWGGTPYRLQYYFGRSNTDSEKEQERAMTVTEGCIAQYTSQVEALWLEQQAPTPDEAHERLEAYKDCLEQAGMVGIEAVSDLGELAELEHEFKMQGGDLQHCYSLDPNIFATEDDLPEFNGPGAG